MDTRTKRVAKEHLLECIRDDGRVVTSVQWWPNGQLKEHVAALPENGRYIVREWRKDGQLKTSLESSGHIPWGRSIETKRDGTKTETYMFGWEQIGPFKKWDREGRLVEEGIYGDGGRTGIWRYWNEKGELTKCEDWRDGEAKVLAPKSCEDLGHLVYPNQFPDEVSTSPP